LFLRKIRLERLVGGFEILALVFFLDIKLGLGLDLDFVAFEAFAAFLRAAIVWRKDGRLKGDNGSRWGRE
jgi:hypothetical protein